MQLLVTLVLIGSCAFPISSCFSQDFGQHAMRQLKLMEGWIAKDEERLSWAEGFKARYDRSGVKQGEDLQNKEFWFRNPEDRTKRISADRKKVVAAKLRRFNLEFLELPQLNDWSAAVGDIGEFRDYKYDGTFELFEGKVIDILPNDRIQISIAWRNYIPPALEAGTPSKIDFSHAILENAPAELRKHRLTFKMPAVHVLGDEVYQATDGPRRIWRLQFLDDSKVKSYQDAVKALDLPDRRTRAWKDKKGSILFDGCLVSYDGVVASVRKLDGSLEVVKTELLSHDDLDFVLKSLWFRTSTRRK